MARPTRNTISHGAESWDADIETNFALVFDTPLPVAIYANFAALPAASSYENCLAITQDTDVLYMSDGATWGAMSTSTFLQLGDTPAAFTGQGGKLLAVNSGETAVEFVDEKDEFTELADTPGTLTGHGGKTVKVNSGATALEFVTDSGVDEFTDLTDTPANFTGHGDKLLSVNSGETAVEFTDKDGFIDLADTPATYTGQAGKYPRVNVGENALEFATVSGGSTTKYSKVMGRFLEISTTEKDTGMRWTANEQIYCKCIDHGALVNVGVDTVAHGIANLGTVVEAWVEVADDNSAAGGNDQVGPGMHATGAADYTYVYFDNTSSKVTTYWNASAHYGKAYLLYTKSTGGGTTETVGCLTHSTSEQVTGWNWIDGRKIYVKTLDTGAMPNATLKSVAHGISNFGELINFSCVAYNGTYRMVQPRTSADSTIVRVTTTNIQILTSTDRSGFNTSHCTLYYTKTDREAGQGETCGPDYSSIIEQYAGFTDGTKKVYFKTIECGALPNNTTKNVAHGISNFDQCIRILGSAYDSVTSLAWFQLPLIRTANDPQDSTALTMNSTNVVLTTVKNLSDFTKSYVTLWYTKT